MKTMKKFAQPLLWLAAAFSFSIKLHAQSGPQLGKSPVKTIIAAMTLEEKAKLVVGMGFRFQSPVPRRDTGANAARDTTVRRPQMPAADPADNIPEKVPGAAGRTHAIPRLGIPSITVSDGPAGIRISPIRNNDSSKTYYATAWPSGTLLASTWDTVLVKRVGMAFGNEIKEYGADVILGPALNIHRNPLGGRNFEYYSEDPLIAGDMTAAMVSGIQSQGVGTSIKHFVANNQETNRNTVNTIVSERAMREIYLKGFEIAVKKAQPWTVMTSYNKLNGPYTSENPELVTTILRKEWGFKGAVMSDWFGGTDPVAQMKAGNDLLMPGTPDQTKKIIDAVNNGTLDVKKLDENVEHILNIILKSPEFKKYAYSNKPDLRDHAQLSRMAATEGMVLLKNDKTLPIKPGKKLALFGNTAYDIIAGGTGSGDVNKLYTINLAQGLSNAGYVIDAAMQAEYQKHIADVKAKRPRPRGFSFGQPPPIPELIMDAATLAQKAADEDAAVITIGRNAGEGADRKMANDFYLSDTEKTIIKNVTGAFHANNKKVIVVLNIGGVVEVSSWADQADAVLLAWQPGLEAGNAIADIISAKATPCGKLATTFPVDYGDVPSAKNFSGKELPQPPGAPAAQPMRGRPAEVTYEEGVYVGYRYYSSFHVKPAFEFGYGLSYTTFNYGALALNQSSVNGKFMATASIVIANNGNLPGKEVVQLYIGAPGKEIDKPAEELKGFAKTRLLRPGDAERVTFTINLADLASFDTKSSAWVVEKGKYTVEIGASSQDIKQTATFNIPRDVVIEKVDKVLVPQVPINELKAE
jgi:beta-glucosidase